MVFFNKSVNFLWLLVAAFSLAAEQFSSHKCEPMSWAGFNLSACLSDYLKITYTDRQMCQPIICCAFPQSVCFSQFKRRFAIVWFLSLFCCLEYFSGLIWIWHRRRNKSLGRVEPNNLTLVFKILTFQPHILKLAACFTYNSSSFLPDIKI